jgi:hypothetical protein
MSGVNASKLLARRSSVFYNTTRRIAKSHRGSTLLEVITATVCASMLLIPTATMLSDAGRWSSRMEQQTELISLVNSCVAETEFQLSSNFRAGQLNNTFASRGFPNSRYTVTYSDSAAVGGIPNRFMIVQILVWTDLNSNAIWDAGEPRQQLSTGLAKRG